MSRGLLKRRVTLILLVLGMAVTLAAGPAAADTVTAPDEGCVRTTATSEAPAAPTTLLNLLLTVVLQPVVLTHQCDGPLFFRGGLQIDLNPTVTEPAGVAALVQIRCLGGGCPVTGVVIPALPGSASVYLRDAGLAPMTHNLPLLGLFPDLPAGNYLLEVVGSGVNASVSTRQVWVLDRGFEPRASRSIPPP